MPVKYSNVGVGSVSFANQPIAKIYRALDLVFAKKLLIQYIGYWLSGNTIETVEITKTGNDVHGLVTTYYNTTWTFDCTYANNTDIDNQCKFKGNSNEGIFWNVKKDIWIYNGPWHAYDSIFRPIYRTRAEAENGSQFSSRTNYLAWANS